MIKNKRLFYAVLFIAVFVIEVMIALFVKDAFVRPYLGDALVTVLICAFLRIFFPKGVVLLPVYVFLFATAVEVLQYFDYAKLLGLHESAFFSTLLGRSFSFIDIICYAVGSAVFFAITAVIDRFSRS